MIGQACETFGWTYDYVVNEVDWRIVRRMIIDLPRPVYDDDKEEKKPKKSKSKFIKERMTAESWINLKK